MALITMDRLERSRDDWLVCLHRKLSEGFERMGFKLVRFEYLSARDIYRYARVPCIEGEILCPCGGKERFRLALPWTMLDYDNEVRVDVGAAMSFAEDLFAHFSDHIRAEVRSGELPPEWLAKL